VSTEADLEALERALGALARRRVGLASMTTYGVGGPAALFADVSTATDLEAVRTALGTHRVPVAVIGRGSNLLVADEGFFGLVIRLGGTFGEVTLPSGLDAEAPQVVTAGAAVPLPVLARQVADAGWSGLAWAVGVPGSVGGAVRMNAGGHGSDMAAVLRRYRWIDLLSERGGTDDVARLHYGYRSSSIAPNEVVCSAELEVVRGDRSDEKRQLSEIVRWRRAHQPGGSNAGSVFANPPGDSAGRLIEACGLKGYRIASAQVSTKHANFIQADQGGRAADILALMDHVADVVRTESGTSLSPEVRLLGFSDDETGAMSTLDGP